MSAPNRQVGAGDTAIAAVSAIPSGPHALLQLAWPVLIGQAAVMASGVIDTVMAGHLSALDLAAVGIGASIYATIFVTGMGILLALTPVVSHHYGAGRHTEIGADVRQCLWLALALSIGAFWLMLNPDIFLALAKPAPEVAERVRAYLDGASFAVHKFAWCVPFERRRILCSLCCAKTSMDQCQKCRVREGRCSSCATGSGACC